MFSDVAGVRSALKARLAPHLPERWEINEFIKQPPTEYRNPLVTFEFTRLESSPAGINLGPRQVGAAIDIVLSSAKSAERTGEDDVDQLALTLVQVIDAQSDMHWESADKQRIESSGQWVWRIHTIVLTSSKE